MGIYLKNILPTTENESERITKSGIPIDQHTKFALLSKLEQGLIHEQLHRKRTQRAIEAALSFLKPGGKYILGPINHAAYHVWSREGEIPTGMAQNFDGNSLRTACRDLELEGKIKYYFTKIDASGDIIDSTDFETGDIAGSLVITKV